MLQNFFERSSIKFPKMFEACQPAHIQRSGQWLKVFNSEKSIVRKCELKKRVDTIKDNMLNYIKKNLSI